MTMHKNMQPVKEKNWDAMQAYFKWNEDKYQHALTIMENDKRYDFQKMFIEDPDLFVFYVRILEEKNPKYDATLFWNLHYQAYQDLKAGGFFNTNVRVIKIAQVTQLVEKLNGKCLLSVQDIEDAMTVKIKKKETTYHFEFHDILHMIEKEYNFRSRGFFRDIDENKKEIFEKFCPNVDYDKTGNVSPVDNLEANYLSIISDYFEDKIEHIDFWHYLVNDGDFNNVSNGSIQSMWKSEDSNDINIEDIIDTEVEMQNYISQVIKRIFFKEISQIEFFDKNAEEIEFYISW